MQGVVAASPLVRVTTVWHRVECISFSYFRVFLHRVKLSLFGGLFFSFFFVLFFLFPLFCFMFLSGAVTMPLSTIFLI